MFLINSLTYLGLLSPALGQLATSSPVTTQPQRRVRHGHDGKCVTGWVAQFDNHVAAFGLVLRCHVGSVVQIEIVGVESQCVFVRAGCDANSARTTASCG